MKIWTLAKVLPRSTILIMYVLSYRVQSRWWFLIKVFFWNTSYVSSTKTGQKRRGVSIFRLTYLVVKQETKHSALMVHCVSNIATKLQSFIIVIVSYSLRIEVLTKKQHAARSSRYRLACALEFPVDIYAPGYLFPPPQFSDSEVRFAL